MAILSDMQPGRVVANHDPENRGRVRVQLYWQGGGPLLWAPVVSGHAGAGFGLMTTPEVGDEVLVGFLDGDPERPAVLGSVWNGAHAGPRERYETGHEAELAGNQVKRVVTKSGIRVHLVDTPGKESITLATPRSNRLVMTEQAAETSRPALVLHSEGDILFEAEGRVHRVAALESHEVAAPSPQAVGLATKAVLIEAAYTPPSTKPSETHSATTPKTSKCAAIANEDKQTSAAARKRMEELGVRETKAAKVYVRSARSLYMEP